MITIQCPGCRSSLGCPAERAGGTFVCPTCGRGVVVPPLATPVDEDSPWETLDLPPDETTPVSRAATTRQPAPRSAPAPIPDEGENEEPEREWFYERDDQPVGPITERGLRAAAENDRLAADARVWTAGMTEWEPGREVLPQVFALAGGDPWGLQRVVAVILATFAFASLLGLGGVYAAKPGDKPTPAPEVAKKNEKPAGTGNAGGGGGGRPVPPPKIDPPKIDPPKSGVPALIARAEKPGNTDDRVAALNELKGMGVEARAAFQALLKLVDDPIELVWRSASDALEATGLPDVAADVVAVEKALADTAPHAKLYAANYFAKVKAKREQLPGLVAALDDKDAATREAAVRALGVYGPDSKPEALGKLFDRLLDPDPAVSDRATRVLESFRPFEGADRATLIKNLSHTEPVFRYLSIRLLNTKEFPTDWETARDLFGRLVTVAEPAPLVREQAIVALARWGVLAKPLAPTLLERTNDEKVSVRIAAIRALGDIGGGPTVARSLAKFLEPQADPRLRAPAIQALLGVEMNTPAIDLPILEQLLAEPDPTTRAAALHKLNLFGAAAEPLLPQIGKFLSDADPEIRAAALKAVAAVGPKAAALAGDVAKFVTDPVAAGPPPVPEAADVAARLRQSAVWISVSRFGRQVWTGSGVLVDAKARFVLTTYHTVPTGYECVVYFPYTDTDGKLETAPAFYSDNAAKLSRTRHAQVGRVVASDPSVDLAVIQLSAAPPDGARAIPFAAQSAKDNQKLHTIGCSAAGDLWRHSTGEARGVVERDMTIDFRSVRCKMLETNITINPGDSGSVVTNDKGELVGVTIANTIARPTRNYAIDLTVAKEAVKVTAGRLGLKETLGAPPPELVVVAGTADATQKLALDALAKMGANGATALAGLLDKPLPREIRQVICDQLGKFGPELPHTAIQGLLEAAAKDAALRPKIADALTKCSGGLVSVALLSRSGWFDGNKRLGKPATVDPAVWIPYQVWILEVIADLQVKSLSEKEKETLLSRLKTFAMADPNLVCREAAAKTYNKLKPLLEPTPKK